MHEYQVAMPLWERRNQHGIVIATDIAEENDAGSGWYHRAVPYDTPR